MKAILPILAVVSAGGLAWHGLAPEQKPEPAPVREPLAQLPPGTVLPQTPGLILLQPGEPPAPLPATVRCTVEVNGMATGTFPLAWDGVGWQGLVTVPGAGTRPVFLQMGFSTYYTPPLFVATVSPFGQATHSPSGAHYCASGPISPLNIRADVTASTRPYVWPPEVFFVFN